MTTKELAHKVVECLISEGYGADVWQGTRSDEARVYCRFTPKHHTRPIELGYVRIGAWCELDESNVDPNWEEKIMQIIRHLDQFEIRG
jgi:hypothetical protein